MVEYFRHGVLAMVAALLIIVSSVAIYRAGLQAGYDISRSQVEFWYSAYSEEVQKSESRTFNAGEIYQ